MRAYYMDDVDGSFTAPHNSGVSLDAGYLGKLGIQYQYNPDVEKVAVEQGYKNRDVIGISKEVLGEEEYQKKLDIFKVEHLHTDIEARLILDGSGYFDVRDRLQNNEKWIRIAVEKDDLIILPPGIFHRFTTDDNGYTRAMRLFTDEPKWQPYNRSNDIEKDPSHIEYLKSIGITV
ncbi:hypothetical protein E3P92_02056 [Wallemia ichthyophaga]|uniref:Acireductone dioxygenase n=2 Tax=Wallemia ichthyophaga TaxID=245174 RepID=A0A4T0J931_WALIC|nr:1,2-dihydroxy-3-keto-5-methylthiopentene dioxygenase 1 [Wallemia ichthyophaga EXF-994]TIA72092.1 hypothetical protein E3P91_02185 [Wallemia ichthyophaga]EOQ99865.1 1,2-dihydroxy-3-keto-5-methylthiopentene dioxygenase 1 [Wallemia ichthyophaga EXF-994]TIA84489.1 hypothetical protein E3P98_00075 [Wallemia ichthyophaga]TIA94051.1 hypothetical protein E3P97_00468 [Wallemia ichthyophaga]TIB04455.1 hypothetical protein E3P95_00274 [Wallemia ichthyophaga]